MRTVAKNAFDKLYKAYGGDLSKWISTYLTPGGPKTSHKPYKQFGTRWMYNGVHILLEVDDPADYNLVKLSITQILIMQKQVSLIRPSI